jgi:hypothetical protein
VDISPASAYKLIADLEALGILREITGGKRSKYYLFDGLPEYFQAAVTLMQSNAGQKEGGRPSIWSCDKN